VSSAVRSVPHRRMGHGRRHEERRRAKKKEEEKARSRARFGSTPREHASCACGSATRRQDRCQPPERARYAK
jgi:hypothetical protein